jgi:hypothetical protein
MESRFIIIDEHRGRDVHGIAEYDSLFHAALSQALLYLRGDVE